MFGGVVVTAAILRFHVMKTPELSDDVALSKAEDAIVQAVEEATGRGWMANILRIGFHVSDSVASTCSDLMRSKGDDKEK